MTETLAPADSGYKIKDGVMVRYQELGLWSGDIPDDVPKAENLNIRWHGAKLPTELLHTVLSFLTHAYRTWKSEAQVRLYYNVEASDWKAVVVPQEVGTGLLSRELKPANMNEDQLKLRAKAFAETEGYLTCGSVHSHCDMSAGQSGIDHRDETGHPGIHITFGNLSENAVHVHGRVGFRGLIYPVCWTDWVDILPENADPDKDSFYYDPPEGWDQGFPEEWLDCCFPAKAHGWGFADDQRHVLPCTGNSEVWLLDDDDDDDLGTTARSKEFSHATWNYLQLLRTVEPRSMEAAIENGEPSHYDKAELILVYMQQMRGITWFPYAAAEQLVPYLEIAKSIADFQEVCKEIEEVWYTVRDTFELLATTAYSTGIDPDDFPLMLQPMVSAIIREYYGDDVGCYDGDDFLPVDPLETPAPVEAGITD